MIGTGRAGDDEGKRVVGNGSDNLGQLENDPNMTSSGSDDDDRQLIGATRVPIGRAGGGSHDGSEGDEDQVVGWPELASKVNNYKMARRSPAIMTGDQDGGQGGPSGRERGQLSVGDCDPSDEFDLEFPVNGPSVKREAVGYWT